MGDMPKSGLEGEKEARAFSVGNFKRKEDLEMYRPLPDYDECLGCDLGVESVLGRIDQKIYANFQMTSWGAVETPFVYGEKPQRSCLESSQI